MNNKDNDIYKITNKPCSKCSNPTPTGQLYHKRDDYRMCRNCYNAHRLHDVTEPPHRDFGVTTQSGFERLFEENSEVVNSLLTEIVEAGTLFNKDELHNKRQDDKREVPNNPKDKVSATKLQLSYIPTSMYRYTAAAMENGAEKYGPFNWREPGMKIGMMNYLSAALGHIQYFIDGEENASDSGVNHLAHSMATLAIILDARDCGNLIDDRPNPGKFSREKFSTQIPYIRPEKDKK